MKTWSAGWLIVLTVLFGNLRQAKAASIVVPSGFAVTVLRFKMEIDGLALSPGGAFGNHIYVTDPISQSIFRIDSSGAVSTFATGFRFTRGGFDLGSRV
ncbi:MAG: hypothetical protein ACREQW_19730 [Candidatus Binatia bacterium]